MDCDHKAVSAQVHKEKAICKAFIEGIISNKIRQCLLEDSNFTLQAAFEKACSLETAQKNAGSYRFASPSGVHVAKVQFSAKDKNLKDLDCSHSGDYSTATAERYMFCGNSRHPSKFCAAKNKICFKHSKKGYFSRMCLSMRVLKKTNQNNCFFDGPFNRESL